MKRLLGLVLALLVPAALLTAGPALGQEPALRVLVYSATFGFRHSSISEGTQQFAALGETAEFDVDLTEDPARISAAGLAPYDVVVFLNTTGEHPFSAQQRQEFLSWMAAGGGFVGTHAAADGNYEWSAYGRIVGAYFLAHPHTGVASNAIEDRASPLVSHLPAEFSLNEEYYRFQLDPRPNVHVLSSLINSSAGPAGATYVDAQPTSWCQEVAGGRSFYTSWGHFGDSYTNPDVWQTVVQGVRWAGGRLTADCSPSEAPPAGRIEAEDGEVVGSGRRATSNEAGAAEVVTGLRHGDNLRLGSADLSDAGVLRVRVAAATMPEPAPYAYPVAQPALGGTIVAVVAGRTVGRVDVAPAPAWQTVEMPLTSATAGFLRLEFTHPSGLTQADLLSVDWVEPGAGAGGGGSGLPTVNNYVVAGREATTTGYLTPAVAVTQGSALTFVNADGTTHDVASTVRGVDGKPLFASAYTDGNGTTSPVERVETLPAGIYDFVCTLHGASMAGRLVVV